MSSPAEPRKPELLDIIELIGRIEINGERIVERQAATFQPDAFLANNDDAQRILEYCAKVKDVILAMQLEASLKAVKS